MKMLWCWRCKAEMAMLDEEEFLLVTSARYGINGEGFIEKRTNALLQAYELVTGVRETNAAAIFHHRLALWAALHELRQAIALAASKTLRLMHATRRKHRIKQKGRTIVRPSASIMSGRLFLTAGIGSRTGFSRRRRTRASSSLLLLLARFLDKRLARQPNLVAFDRKHLHQHL